MGVIAKTCVSCGKALPLSVGVGERCPHCSAVLAFEATHLVHEQRQPNFRYLLLVAGVVLAVAALGAVGLGFARRGSHREVAALKAGFRGAPAERLQAARALVAKPLPFVSQFASDYVEAIRTADAQTRIGLLRQLIEINRSLERWVGAHPSLPPNLVSALRNELHEDDPAVAAVLDETLEAIGAEPAVGRPELPPAGSGP